MEVSGSGRSMGATDATGRVSSTRLLFRTLRDFFPAPPTCGHGVEDSPFLPSPIIRKLETKMSWCMCGAWFTLCSVNDLDATYIYPGTTTHPLCSFLSRASCFFFLLTLVVGMLVCGAAVRDGDEGHGKRADRHLQGGDRLRSENVSFVVHEETGGG